MSVVPSRDVDAIQFFEAHVPIWLSQAANVGLTVGQVNGLDTVVKDARIALTAQIAAKEAAKASTTALRNAVFAMRGNGSDLIRTIKAFAATSGNPNVYAIAEIPPPAPPSPAPPPGQPTTFKVELTPSGAIMLSWKAVNATASSGVYFSIRRKLSGEGAFTLIGNTGSKTFVDDTITQGTNGATYIIRGYRGVNPGPESEQLSVQFGVGGSGVSRTLNIAA